jgi:endogenous inhibitor of DNA gyrase (YacG/DUF329 family)
MAQSKPPKQLAAVAGKCPICGRATVVEYRPFCSRRCADVDLSRWLGGAYAIPVTDDSDEDGEGGDPSPSQGSGGPQSPH